MKILLKSLKLLSLASRPSLSSPGRQLTAPLTARLSTVSKTIECKAAILWKEGQPLTVETISVDPPQEGEVRVKMVSAGLCATDGHFVWGWPTDLAPDFDGNPVVLGHEGAGVVESVGVGVTSVRAGDQVILMWMPQCDQCSHCANPMTNFCKVGNLATILYHDDGTTRMKVKNIPLLSFGGTSTFSQYSVVRESQLAKVNDKCDLKTACIIGCAVGTGYNSATHIAKVHEGSTCVIWGLGAIGLSVVLGCRDRGAAKIIGIDTNPEKEAIAKQMGCHLFLNPNKLVVDKVLQGFDGVDYAFDCVGNHSVVDSALKSLTPWGTLSIIGLGPKGDMVSIPTKDILTGQTVTGGYFGNAKPRKANQHLVDLLCAGRLNIEPMITHRIELKDINKGFDLLKAGKTIRTVIQY